MGDPISFHWNPLICQCRAIIWPSSLFVWTFQTFESRLSESEHKCVIVGQKKITKKKVYFYGWFDLRISVSQVTLRQYAICPGVRYTNSWIDYSVGRYLFGAADLHWNHYLAPKRLFSKSNKAPLLSTKLKWKAQEKVELYHEVFLFVRPVHIIPLRAHQKGLEKMTF